MDKDLPTSLIDQVRPMQQSVQCSSEFGIVQMTGFDFSSTCMLIWEFTFAHKSGTRSKETVLSTRNTRDDTCSVIREQDVLWDDSPCSGVSALTERDGSNGTGIPQGMSWRWFGVILTYAVVSSLVFIVNPVQALISPVLHAVLGHPLVDVTAPLGEDPWNHLDLLQIYL